MKLSNRGSFCDVVIWALVAAYLSFVALYAWEPSPFALWLAAIGCICALTHGVLTYGLRTALVFMTICLTVSFTAENIGSSTGWIFGRYHFEVGTGLPCVGNIPIIVGGVWFGMGYFAWNVASVILDRADRRLNEKSNILLLPIVSALVMTQWDFVMDAPMATISKAWIWRDGGGIYGVPLSNYLGWLLTSWLFYLGFALYLSGRSLPTPTHEKEYSLIAILFYTFSGFAHLTPWLMNQTGTTTDASGYGWRIHDIREETVAAMLFTTLFTSIIAGVRLLGIKQRES